MNIIKGQTCTRIQLNLFYSEHLRTAEKNHYTCCGYWKLKKLTVGALGNLLSLLKSSTKKPSMLDQLSIKIPCLASSAIYIKNIKLRV